MQDDEDCRMSLPLAWGIMIALFFIYSLLAVYLTAVLPDASGVRDPPYFFLLPSYWRPRIYKSTTIHTAQLPAPDVRQLDEDVAAEADKMRARLQANGGHISAATAAAAAGSAHNGNAVPAIEVYGLQRRFGRGSNEFWAVCDSWFEIPKQQLFCLLGPNGAGALSRKRIGQLLRQRQLLSQYIQHLQLRAVPAQNLFEVSLFQRLDVRVRRLLQGSRLQSTC